MALDFDFSSPVEAITLPLFAARQVKVFVKRDDLIHPFISGNKWRKLKPILNLAEAENKKTLVTFGGAWSNHLLATACAGAKFGFQTHGFVRGESVQNPVLSLCRLYGMELHFVDRSAYRDKQRLFDAHFSSDDAVYIHEGGYGKLAASGCAEIIEELPQVYDHIFVASGTGTTAAGLASAVLAKQWPTQIHAVPVLKGGSFLKDDIRALAITPDDIVFHLDYHFGGYAKHNAELICFIRDFVRDTGMMIEPTYTGKAFYALTDLVKRGYFNAGTEILLIHTGGLTGFLGMYEQF